ncbi:hypothetical protein ACSVH2_10525 [Flavobacterium sp. RSB2_4_14]|uniref:hypothetical protein n=1 Tax=Flavobacterium sp. RSB2_4_14 TaxID=3447665 RepID=UPI003F3D7F36
MKKILLLLALVPIIGLSQTKNVITASRVFAKNGKTLELEKAIAAHAQKYHTGEWKWRVFEILSGPDAGGYHIVEGPNSWAEIDSRNNLGDVHMADWVKSVEALTEGRQSSSFSVYREDLSAAKLTDFTDKIAVNHIYPKQGEFDKVESRLKKLKKVWEASGQNVVVYQASSSGAPQLSIVTRYKTGWKERETGFLKPMKERYDAIYGEGAYQEWMEETSPTEKSWGEMLSFRPDLSSK